MFTDFALKFRLVFPLSDANVLSKSRLVCLMLFILLMRVFEFTVIVIFSVQAGFFNPNSGSRFNFNRKTSLQH